MRVQGSMKRLVHDPLQPHNIAVLSSLRVSVLWLASYLQEGRAMSARPEQDLEFRAVALCLGAGFTFVYLYRPKLTAPEVNSASLSQHGRSRRKGMPT